MSEAATETPFGVSKMRRTKRDLLQEHRQEMLADARELGRSAATEFEIAAYFGVAQSTVQLWRAHDPQFDACLRIGRDIADDAVEATLYHRARGYSFPSEKIFFHKGQVTRVNTIEHVPPDTTAMIFWLKNRRRKDWTDQTDVNVTGAIELNVNADPRALAIAMIATLRAGIEAPAPTIGHQEADK